MSDQAFQAQVLSVFREVHLALREIREGLAFPAAEHAGYQVDQVEEAIRALETVFVYGA